jgi:carboxymethylenebutenolidase
MPSKGGPFPVVLVVQEIFGVHEHIKDVCRRFAKLGYFAVAPELYYRQGDVSKLKSIDEIRPIVAKVPDEQVMSDLDATVEFAQKSGKGDVAKLGITGFCWGGRIVWLYAAHSKQLKAGVAWYGRLVGDPTPNMPKHPVNIAADLNAPVLGLYGGKDQGIPLERSSRCAPRSSRRRSTRKSSCIPTRRTRSSRTIALHTKRAMPTTRGKSCKPGSNNMAWRNDA